MCVCHLHQMKDSISQVQFSDLFAAYVDTYVCDPQQISNAAVMHCTRLLCGPGLRKFLLPVLAKNQ